MDSVIQRLISPSMTKDQIGSDPIRPHLVNPVSASLASRYLRKVEVLSQLYLRRAGYVKADQWIQALSQYESE